VREVVFLDSIDGMDLVFHTEPPKGSIILVVGGAGTLKSTFLYNLLQKYLDGHTDERAVYITFEESKEGHLNNIKSMGIPTTPHIQIVDVASFKADLEVWDSSLFKEEDYLNLILERATAPLSIYEPHSDSEADDEEHSPGYIVIDSMNALLSLLGVEGPVIRRKLQEFFFKLRKKGVTTFIILETQMVDDRPEYFLVDGIIEMGTDKLGNDIKRYMAVRKMRATRHEMKPFLLEASPEGIKVIGELF
jgi:KaiC/GvpD/RAD55 family RecA-like ATPase